MIATGASASGRPQNKQKNVASNPSTKTPVTDLEPTQVPMAPDNKAVLHQHGGPAPACNVTLSAKEQHELELLFEESWNEPSSDYSVCSGCKHASNASSTTSACL